MATNPGIDYGMGLSNCDHKTSIRYGVISMHEVLQTWTDSSEAQYTPTCPYCGNKLKQGFDAKRCGSCHRQIDPDRDFDMLEPDCFTYDTEGYQCQQSSDDTDIFIIKSPYYTYCQFCSPCAPGAGYIMHSVMDGIRAYCFGHDWFEDDNAPYPVFKVSDNTRVMP